MGNNCVGCNQPIHKKKKLTFEVAMEKATDEAIKGNIRKCFAYLVYCSSDRYKDQWPHRSRRNTTDCLIKD